VATRKHFKNGAGLGENAAGEGNPLILLGFYWTGQGDEQNDEISVQNKSSKGITAG
jgi:hypothetical protein